LGTACGRVEQDTGAYDDALDTIQNPNGPRHKGTELCKEKDKQDGGAMGNLKDPPKQFVSELEAGVALTKVNAS
jgi:hypothetical protein